MSDAISHLHQWLGAAGSRAQILPPAARASITASLLGVSDRAMLHAVCTQLGAVLVDDGWVRVLGGGADGCAADLASWNGLATEPVFERTPGLFVVAFDVLGGVFAMDGGALGGTVPGAMHYFAPDSLAWESLEIPHSSWLHWLLTDPAAVDAFYENVRWPGWRDEVRATPLDEAIHTWPPPWTVEGKDLARVSRKRLPAHAVVGAAFEMADQVAGRSVPGPRPRRDG